MFSGIIEHVGQITAVTRQHDAMEIVVRCGFEDFILGESIALEGVCLTVTRAEEGGHATFFISSETLERTTLSRLEVGQRVNLERAVRLSTRLSGHIVQGHVDGCGRLLHLEERPGGRALRFAIPASLRRYMVEKGSITINGISLTINAVGEPGASPAGPDSFYTDIMVIPHTWEHTSLSHLQPGSLVNVEVDVIAKYVENICHYK